MGLSEEQRSQLQAIVKEKFEVFTLICSGDHGDCAMILLLWSHLYAALLHVGCWIGSYILYISRALIIINNIMLPCVSIVLTVTIMEWHAW